MDAIYNSFWDAIAFNPLAASTTVAYNWWNGQPIASNPITGAGQNRPAGMSPLLMAALALGGGYLLWKWVK
jgi:hypothetical protein